jgi:hypothetical protein
MTNRKVIFFFLSLLLPVNAQEASEALLEALAYMPTPIKTVMFTDLTLIKEYENAINLTGASSAEDKKAFYDAFASRQIFLSELNLTSSRHYAVWGWDLSDVRWTLTALGDVPFAIIALRQDFDIDIFTRFLEERKFSVKAEKNFTSYEHERDLTAEWVLGNFWIFNVSVLESENIILLSPFPVNFEAVLSLRDSGNTYASVDSVQTVAKQLGEVAGLVLETDGCLAYTANPWTDQLNSPQIEEMKEKLGIGNLDVSPYQTLALSYHYDGTTALGTLVMHYTSVTAAQNDLEARKIGASEGMSFTVNQSYKESVFGLESATTDNNSIIFKLRPVKNEPKRLFEMLYQRDMPFAGC